jgi:hypothetical protein
MLGEVKGILMKESLFVVVGMLLMSVMQSMIVFGDLIRLDCM